MPLSRARGFHGNHEGSLTTYDHVNSDGSQSVRATNCNRVQSQNRRKATDDVSRMPAVCPADDKIGLFMAKVVSAVWVSCLRFRLMIRKTCTLWWRCTHFDGQIWNLANTDGRYDIWLHVLYVHPPIMGGYIRKKSRCKIIKDVVCCVRRRPGFIALCG
jgi:hypothetical protein